MSDAKSPQRTSVPLRSGKKLPLRKGIERLNRKYAKTLEKLAK